MKETGEDLIRFLNETGVEKEGLIEGADKIIEESFDNVRKRRKTEK